MHERCKGKALTKYNILYVVEIKFYKDAIKEEVVAEVKEKISRIKTPKHFSILPVLIHVCGVSDQVVESEFFAHILDFAVFFENDPA